MSHSRKRIEHEILHIERTALNAIAAFKKISGSLPDANLHDFNGELDLISHKVTTAASDLFKRIENISEDGRHCG